MISNIFVVGYLFILIKFSSNSFQDNILKKILEKNEKENIKENIMISPFSLYQVLSLLSNGAKGDTQKEILKVLYPDKEINDNLVSEINSNMNTILSNIESENIEDTSKIKICDGDGCKIIFNDVNGIFVKKGFQLTEQFIQKCDNYNTSYFELIDAEQINKFCSDNTNGKIDNIINSIDPQTILMLINAIYFKGTWMEKFSEDLTEKRDFTNSDKTINKVDTMYIKFPSQKYYEDKNVKIISLPYISNKLGFEMIIILPDSNKYSSALDYLKEEKVVLSEIPSKLQSKENIHLYLPKFNYKFNMNLKEILNDLGMKLAFSESANFDELCQNQNSYVDSISQFTYINLNENGTEAAAVTVGSMPTSAAPNEEYFMKVDHSFIYMIKSNKINDIEGKNLMPFIGIVNSIDGEKVGNAEETDSDDPVKIEHQNNLKFNIGIIISLIILLYS